VIRLYVRGQPITPVSGTSGASPPSGNRVPARSGNYVAIAGAPAGVADQAAINSRSARSQFPTWSDSGACRCRK
jgi:hypothetical protein